MVVSPQRTGTRVWFALLAISAFLAPLAAHQQQEPPPATGLILGRVVDADSGQPLAGAIVRVGRSGATGPARDQQAVTTTASGYFVLRDLPAAAIVVSATMDGYITGGYGRTRPDSPPRPLMLAAGERRTDVEIRLWKAAATGGRIVDELGEPAVGVSVRALRRSMSARGGLANAASTTTDDRGVYRLANLAPGDYYLVVPSSATTVPISAAAEYYTAVQEGRTSELSRERMESRAPMPGSAGMRFGDYLLQLGSGLASRGLAPPQPAPGEPLHLYPTVYYPSTRSFEDAEVVSLTSGANRDGLDFALQLVPTARISGTVVGPDGPAANMGVHLTPASMSAFSQASTLFETATAITDSSGRFAMFGVPDGEYVVSVLKMPRNLNLPSMSTTITTGVGGMTFVTGTSMPTQGPTAPPTEPSLWAKQSVTISTGDVDGLSLQLREGIELAGQVDFDGAADRPAPERVSALSIRLVPVDGVVVSIAAVARPDGEGRFRLQGHPPGRYDVQVSGSPGVPWTLATVSVDGHDATGESFELDEDSKTVVIRMTDRPAGLSGTVQRPAGNSDNLSVVLLPADVTRWMSNGFSQVRVRTVDVARRATTSPRPCPIAQASISATRIP